MHSVRLQEFLKKNLSMIIMKMLCSWMIQFKLTITEDLVFVHLKLALNLVWQVLMTMQTLDPNIWLLKNPNFNMLPNTLLVGDVVPKA
jgi:hypothetical protein